MTGELPDVKDGEVTREVRFAGTSSEVEIRVKNCGEYYVYRLRPTPGATYVYSIGELHGITSGRESEIHGLTSGREKMRYME